MNEYQTAAYKDECLFHRPVALTLRMSVNLDIVEHYGYMALAKKTSVLREAMLLLFEAFEVRIAKCCKQR